MTDMSQQALRRRAAAVTPGGVHSPVRALAAVGGDPLFMRAATGARLETVDGRYLTDYCMSFGPLILGHADPEVAGEVRQALERGWSFGTAETVSLELAELVCAELPFVDQLRFMNSGTEAVMTALRLARGATGRDSLLKFSGCYHGHTDAMLIRAGSGLAGGGAADSAGIPAGVIADTRVAELDDEASLHDLFDRHGDELAAAIIEPLPANYGLLPQRRAFLNTLQSLCRRHGALLILDEVITGFRVSFGGCAEALGLAPDLVTYGKIIGGGFPVGALGGRRDLMEQLAPAGSVYQAGTLSANPVAMTAGLATLRRLTDRSVYAELERLGRRLEQGIEELENTSLQRIGSLFWLVPDDTGEKTIRRPDRFPAQLADNYARLFRDALAANIYLPPSPFETGFLSLAHGEDDIDYLLSFLAGKKKPPGGGKKS